jgi:hypothetical protein
MPRRGYDGWVEGVPCYKVPGTGLRLEVGTTYPSDGDSAIVLKLCIPSSVISDKWVVRRVLREARRHLLPVVEDNAASQAVMRLGQLDKPSDLPMPALTDADGVVTAFWAAMPEMGLGLGMKFNYQRDLVEKFKTAIRDGERRGAAWFPAPWRVWVMKHDRDIPAALGCLRSQGFKLKWVEREGFPPPPPIEVMG